MDKMLIYLGETIVVLGIFYSAYWFALRKGIYHKLSRFYLLTSVVLALLLPLNFFSINIIGRQQPTEKTIDAVANAKLNYKTLVASMVGEQTKFSKNQSLNSKKIRKNKIAETKQTSSDIHYKPVLYNGLLWIYLIGTLFFLLRLIWQIRSIGKLITLGETEKENNITFVYIDKNDSPYSFGKHLFIPYSLKESPEFHSILEHEKAHIHQKHTYDLLFLEFISALIWINPFIWVLRNSLRKVHEYLADEQVIKNGHDSINYQALLLEKVISTKTITLTSAFHFKSLSQRLAMIKKLSKTVSARIKILRGIPASLAIALALLIGVIVSCENKDKQAFNLVKIQGDGQFYNFSTSSFGYILTANDSIPTTMLARAGDLIAAEDDFFPYESGQSYQFSSPANGIIMNNGKVFSIKLSDNQKTLSWLQQLESVDLSTLDHIEIGKKLPADYEEYLNIISEANPNIGINIDKWNEDMPAIVKMFDPGWLAISEMNLSEFNQLLPLPNLELLLLSTKDGHMQQALPALPKLEHLLLTDIDSGSTVIPDFLINNPQIESVECGDCENTDYQFLNSVKQLKSLMILNTELSLDLQFLNEFKSLTRISILINEGKNWEVLQNSRNLNWLVLCGDISQQQFDQTIKANPKLQVVENVDCDSVNNLAVLKNLKQLKAVTVSDTLRDAETPLLLSDLTYISLPSEIFQDSVYMNKLQKALPQGIIVPNDGFCMGSGWFIFFIPALLFLAWMRKRLFPKTKSKSA